MFILHSSFLVRPLLVQWQVVAAEVMVMIYTCVVQNTLGRGGFTCVDMRHYTDVSGVQ